MIRDFAAEDFAEKIIARVLSDKKRMGEFIQSNVLGSTEVQDLLMVNRQRLKALVDGGKLTPIKELKREMLFLLQDVNKLKKEMLLDSRTNLYKAAKPVADEKEAE